jgi:hypothetical protein
MRFYVHEKILLYTILLHTELNQSLQSTSGEGSGDRLDMIFDDWIDFSRPAAPVE